MIGYRKMLNRLKEIKSMGFVKTHRVGNTGVGKTLEDLLGIQENNIPGPNGRMIELKSARKDAKSMLTLFTKSPLPAKANSVLLEKFGYETEEERGKKSLHTTINAVDYNTLKEDVGLKIGLKSDRIVILDKNKNVLGYWDKETLKNSFERKLPKIIYVKADAKGSGEDEKFWFNEAWLLGEFSFDNFMKMLKDKTILVDIRIGQYPDGRPHDHGTGFRVMPSKLDLCFEHRKKVM